MYKVFFNNSFLVIANKNEADKNQLDATPFKNEKQFIDWLATAQNNATSETKCFTTDNTEETFKLFASKFRIIEAAGGLVENSEENYLMIFRRGKWDMAKGKIDKGETPEQAAVREVEEETGAKKLSISKFLQHTYHLYFLKEELVLKKTYWYLMQCKSNKNLQPQTSEDIERALWLPYNEILPLKPLMHGSISDIIENYFEKKD
jgi:8-oxo-dGTP pyrophosphatase MutT (NUDIX family)